MTEWMYSCMSWASNLCMAWGPACYCRLICRLHVEK
jgi:hypothetical protein